MNKFIVTLLSTVVIVVGAYTACWFKESADIKNDIEQNIAAFNEKQKTSNLHYESVVVSGFPLAINIEFIKPVISVNIADLIKTLPNKPAQTTAKPDNWLLEVKTDSLTLSSSILANNFAIKSAIQSEFKSIVNNQLQNSFLINYENPYSCNLKVANQDGIPLNIGKSFADAKSFLTALRSFSCLGENGTTKDAKTGNILHSTDKINITINSEPVGNVNQKLGLIVDIKNSKSSPEFDKVSNDFIKLFYTQLGTPESAQEQNFSAYGSMSLLLDLGYTGPINENDFNKPETDIHVDINAFNLKSDVANSELSLHFATSPQAGQRNSNFVFNSHSNVSEKYDQILAKSIAHQIEIFSKIPALDPTSDMMKKNIALLGKPEEVAAIITPKFHEFGFTTSDIDLNITSENDAKNPLKNSVLTLKDFDWLATQYGFKINGNAAFGSEKPPAGALALNLQNGDNLVSDLGKYLAKVETLWIKIQPHTPYVTAPLVEGTKKFLHDISDKNAKDISISLVTNEKGLTISGKQVMEVIGLFGTDIAPYLPQPAANKQ